MHSGNNRTNHDFQIAYFLIGACHTPDAAYALLCDLHEGRDTAIKCFDSAKMREEAKRIRAQRKIDSGDEADALEGRADLSEMEAMREVTDRNLAAAIAERAFIEKCMRSLEPHRQYAHLSLPEAHEATQRDEWKFELLERAENHLLSHGVIPPDQLGTMRMHPDFGEVIFPHIQKFQDTLMRIRSGKFESQEQADTAVANITDLTIKRSFVMPELPTLLPAPEKKSV